MPQASVASHALRKSTARSSALKSLRDLRNYCAFYSPAVREGDRPVAKAVVETVQAGWPASRRSARRPHGAAHRGGSRAWFRRPIALGARCCLSSRHHLGNAAPTGTRKSSASAARCMTALFKNAPPRSLGLYRNRRRKWAVCVRCRQWSQAWWRQAENGRKVDLAIPTPFIVRSLSSGYRKKVREAKNYL